MKEADFQRTVIDAAHRFGWRVAHFRTSRTLSGGWATAVQGDGAGFPDLVLVHPKGALLVRELKSATGRLSKDQERWIADFHAAGVNAGVWRPEDWGLIELELQGLRWTAA